MLKAIETKYKGYRFRSRLEARWAVFLDTLSVRWEYEAQGYDLGSAGLYLPDFQIGNSTWFEIKPETPSLIEFDKGRELARQADGFVLMLAGTPGAEKIWVLTKEDFIGPNLTDGYCLWCDFFHLCPVVCSALCPKTRKAYDAARSARFEHGESGYVG